MKKTLVNADIMTIYNTLNTLKGRNDITIGDMSIYWANKNNLKTLGDATNFIQEAVQEIVQKYFTEENSEMTEDGQRAIKKEYQEEIMGKINVELNKLNIQTMDIEIKTITKESFEKFTNSNAEKLTMLELTVFEQFVEE